jgi:hypothetical protein
MKALQHFLTTLFLPLVLAACVAGQSDRLAVATDPDDESGIGGTGIIGMITGFGSIFVNGVEVEIDNKTQLYVNDQPVERSRFERGDVVEILATEYRGMTRASQLQVRHEVIGTVESTDGAHFTVLGQTIRHDGQNGLLPGSGDKVQVSGFRDASGVIHATRIARSEQKDDLLRGPAHKVGDGYFYIGKQKVTAGDTLAIRAGNTVRVRGHIQNGSLMASSVTVVPSLPFGRAVRHLLVQGFINKQGPGLRIDHIPFTVAENHTGMPLTVSGETPVRMEIRRDSRNHWVPARLINEKDVLMGSPVPVLRNTPRWHSPAFPGMPGSRPQHPGRGGRPGY